MATNTETGYARDLANAHKILTISSSLGTEYAPGNAAISLQAISSRYDSTKTLMEDVQSAESEWKKQVRDRRAAFAQLIKSLALLNRHLKSFGPTGEELKAVTHCIAKLRGERIGSAPESAAGEVAGNSHSVSQVGFDNLLKHYKDLIACLRSITAYTTTEPGFTIADLQAAANNLETLNQNAFNALAGLTSLRDQRNRNLFADKQSLVVLSTAARSYLLSKLESGTPVYKQVMGIKFRGEH